MFASVNSSTFGALTEETTLLVTLRQEYGEARTIGRLRLSAITGDVSSTSFPEDIIAIGSLPAALRRPAQWDHLRRLLIDQDLDGTSGEILDDLLRFRGGRRGATTATSSRAFPSCARFARAPIWSTQAL